MCMNPMLEDKDFSTRKTEPKVYDLGRAIKTAVWVVAEAAFWAMFFLVVLYGIEVLTK